MDYNAEQLDTLISLKKNKSHKITKSEAGEFTAAWLALISHDNGFSEKAEKYLYEGVVFAGAKPFVTWVLSCDDKYGALDELFKGKMFGRDGVTTFRLLISTLIHLINGKPEDANLICPVIKRLPAYSKNKDGKTIGDGHRILLKYFISEVSNATTFPLLADLNMKNVFISDFVGLFDELIERIDEIAKAKERARIYKIQEWLHPSVSASSTQIEENTQSTNPETEEKTEQLLSLIATVNENGPASDGRKAVDLLILELRRAISSAEIVHASIKNYEGTVASLQETERALRRENASLSARIESLQEQENILRAEAADYRNQVYLLNTKVDEIEQRNLALKQEIARRDEEITDRSQMMEALSRDRAKQSEELIHRLASKLRVEYRDFKDAEELPMDCDLGENMREQIKNIFAILVKAGIPLD